MYYFCLYVKYFQRTRLYCFAFEAKASAKIRRQIQTRKTFDDYFSKIFQFFRVFDLNQVYRLIILTVLICFPFIALSM